MKHGLICLVIDPLGRVAPICLGFLILVESFPFKLAYATLLRVGEVPDGLRLRWLQP